MERGQAIGLNLFDKEKGSSAVQNKISLESIISKNLRSLKAANCQTAEFTCFTHISQYSAQRAQ